MDANPRGYSHEEIDALPTDVWSWDRSRFAGPTLTVRELREYKEQKPDSSVCPAYGTPQFRVGDVVQYCHDGKRHEVKAVQWCDCSGCGHYSFWRVIVPGNSDQECNFQPAI